VLYFCDNGPNSWRWNGGMKGRKGTVDEGGVRSPLLLRWPGQVPKGRSIPQIAGAIDLLPTLASLAGVPVKAGKPLDGKDLSPLLLGRKGDWPDRRLFSHWNKRTSVRTQQYRLDAEGRLFDMQADPGQRTDIAAERPQVAAELKKAVSDWAAEVLPAGPDTRPYPVGHTKLTYLPARDGEASGGIARSNRAPNRSYFTHWTDTEGRISWDIEVAQAGDYEAVIHYTAAEAGSTLELAFAGARIEHTIADAHNPPAYGMKEDRHERGTESYAKAFRPLKLGVLRLAATRGRITLRATKVAGREVAEVRYLLLQRA